MEKSFFKNIIKSVKDVYLKILPLTISLAFLFISIILISLLGNYWPLLSFVVLFFLFFPLLLSIQLMCTRIFAYKDDFNYLDIYKELKVYYSPIFNGTYKVFTAFFISFISASIFTSIYEYILLFIKPELMELIYSNNMDEFIIEVFNIQYFDLALSIIFGLTILVFLWRIFAKLTHPYFNYFCGLQKLGLKKFLSNVRRKKLYPYNKKMFIIGLPLFIIYLFSFIPSIVITYFLTYDMYISLALSISITALLCSLYLPIYIKGCHVIVTEIKPISVNFVKEEVKREYNFVNNSSLSEEEKNLLKSKMDSLKKMLNISDDEEDDKKDD